MVRGGYSIFYNEAIYNTLARELAFQAPVDTVQTLTTTSTAPLTFQNGFQPEQQPTGFIPNTQAVDPNYKPGYAQIWNLGAETSISQNWILDLTYTGTKGTNLDILRAPNRAPARHSVRSDSGESYRQERHRLHVRSVRRQLDLQRSPGARRPPLHARSDASGHLHLGKIARRCELHRRHARRPSSSRTATCTASTVSRLSTFATSSALFRCTSFHSESAAAGPITAWKEKVFGDWRLQNIFTWQTGTPFTVLLGGVASDNGTGANFSLRPNMTGNPNPGNLRRLDF